MLFDAERPGQSTPNMAIRHTRLSKEAFNPTCNIFAAECLGGFANHASREAPKEAHLKPKGLSKEAFSQSLEHVIAGFHGKSASSCIIEAQGNNSQTHMVEKTGRSPRKHSSNPEG